MKPYYQDDAVTIYHGDCFEILPCIETGSVDLVLTDPDYNGKDLGVRQGSYEGAMPHLPIEEYEAFCMQWFSAVSRLTDRIAFSPGIANAWFYPAPRWALAWFKPGAVAYNKTGGFNIWEPILVYGEKIPRIQQDAYESTPLNFTREEWAQHPCPKHPGMWRWVLNNISRPNETVLDIFAGSGTTGRVAKDLGRKAILIERVERYCEIAAKRMAQTVLRM